MKVMVMVKATKASEAGEMPGEQLLTEMGQFNEELVKAGVMLAGEGLHPSSNGKRVRFSGASRVVIDGPFAETNELVAGFWMWNVKSMQEAVDWVKRCPNPMLEDSEIEIRQVFSAEDFGEALTPELREQEASQRARTLGLEAPRFENGRELLVAGLNETFNLETRHQIPELWTRFMSHACGLPGQAGPETYGVSWNFQSGRQFDYLTGVEVSEGARSPEGFTQVRIPAGRYAVIPYSGHVSKMPELFDTIYTKWLPESGVNAAHSPAFEKYTEKFDSSTLMGGMEIWIPLQA